MNQDVIDELNKKEESDFHKALLDHALGLVKLSRAEMSKHYNDWDLQDQVYRGVRMLDSEDIKQATKDKPVKMVVPNTFAQVMTFSSFLFLLFNQNRTFFELNPTGIEDYRQKEQDCEALLERDIKHHMWNVLLFQHLRDVGRFGPSIFECCWTRELTHAYISAEPTVVNFNGVQSTVRGGSEWKEYVKYEGNLIRNVSPYRWFPDTRFPLTDFQSGEFCAAEEEYSMAALRKLEAVGEVAGTEHIQPLPQNLDKLRGGPTRASIDVSSNKQNEWLYGTGKTEGLVLVTKMQVWLTPSKFTYGPNEKKLGPEEFPILYHLWYANDNKVIRCEPAYWWHNKFGWTLSQFTPDMHHTVTLGLADLIYRLQDVITWHINSRITDVRRNLRGRLIVDPFGIETSSLDGDGDIYLRSGASKSGVDRWVSQLKMADVTQGHLNDAEILGKIMQVVTGVNDNIMGQYNQGRRSAQEARTVLSGAAGRMKLHGHLVWDSGLGPLGKMMLSNLRQSLPVESFSRSVGGPPEEMQARYAAFKGTPEEVICGEDYMMFDSTMQSEKGFMAQSLQDLLVAILQSDPTAASRMAREIDPAKIVEEIQYLRGAGNVQRFKYTPEEQQQIIAEQKARLALEQEKARPKPPSISLSGKLTPAQEAVAATAALGSPQQVGEPQGNGSGESTKPRV
jgi:hypothetical protein